MDQEWDELPEIETRLDFFLNSSHPWYGYRLRFWISDDFPVIVPRNVFLVILTFYVR